MDETKQARMMSHTASCLWLLLAQLPQVVGLALCAVGNLATPDMARDLAMEVDKHLQPGGSSNLRKKAALCTVGVKIEASPAAVAQTLDVRSA